MSKKIESLSFEDALSELEEILTRIDKGEAKLDDAVALFERAAELRKHCEKKLDSAKLRIEKVVQSADKNKVLEKI